MLTLKDIRNPKNESGFSHVVSAGGVSSHRHRAGSNGKPWHAHRRQSSGSGPNTFWNGPRRATPEESAQDYCDHVNGLSIPSAPLRPSAGHSTNKRKRKIHPKRAEAYRLLAEARADESKSDDDSGYIYCIGEKGQPQAVARVKLGKSKDDPIYRLAGLQTGNPRVLYVIASKKVANRHAAEKRLHDRFAEHCCTNEWFWATDILDEVLAEFK